MSCLVVWKFVLPSHSDSSEVSSTPRIKRSQQGKRKQAENIKLKEDKKEKLLQRKSRDVSRDLQLLPGSSPNCSALPRRTKKFQFSLLPRSTHKEKDNTGRKYNELSHWDEEEDKKTNFHGDSCRSLSIRRKRAAASRENGKFLIIFVNFERKNCSWHSHRRVSLPG